MPDYTWKQTLQEVTVTIPVPEGTRAKLAKVDIGAKSIKASLITRETPFIDGELYNNVRVDDSTWTIVDQKELVITLEKVNQTEWWPHVITSDPKIDVTKIQPESSNLSDLDPETRAMVEKMMYDQRQKEQGQPTADELKKQQMFEQFKKQHPEMDFSNVEIN